MGDGFDSGGGGDLGGIFDPLLSGLGAIIASIIAFLNALVAAIINVVNFLYQGELGILGFADGGLTQVFKGLKGILDQVFKIWVTGALTKLWDLYRKLTAFVRKLKQWLDKFRKLQQLQLMRALRRYLNLIQRIRRILVVFKFLHIGIAKKLDAWLARLEGKLIGGVFKQLAKTNEIARWVNLIVDPRGLLHPGAVLAGFGGLVQGIKGALSALRPGEFNCVPGQQVGPGVAVRPWIDVQDRLLTESRDKSGDSAAVTAQFAQARGWWSQDIGGTGGA